MNNEEVIKKLNHIIDCLKEDDAEILDFVEFGSFDDTSTVYKFSFELKEKVTGGNR